jgi:class 3 adenylate cyclase/tetratricopeptide (TPR) repeat protein
MDPESLRLVLSRYFDEMRSSVEDHGGAIEKFIGDAVLAVFGVPQVHEDDALRAIRAADEMRTRLLRLNEELARGGDFRLQIRIGVNTGEVLADDIPDRDRIVTGDSVNVAARLQQAAGPGQILIGEETFRLVRGAIEVESIGPLVLKGKGDRLPAYRVREIIAGARARTRRLDAPMVGRRRALSVLRSAFDGAVDDRVCQLVTVLGPAGVGKSRLVEEFIACLPKAAVYRGRCLPYGEGVTFFPVVEIMKQATGSIDVDGGTFRDRLASLVDDDDEHRDAISSRVAQLAGVADAPSAEETFWACRRLFEAIAGRRPLVLVLDDIQWGGTTFLDLVENIADLSRDVPILLLAMARPDLLDSRPGWGGGKLNAVAITLEPLSEEDCGTLIDSLLGTTELDPDVRRRIAEAAGGTPLFVEEMLAKLIDDGLLTKVDDRWEAVPDLSNVPLPLTIATLLAARIDQLPVNERAVLERAAIAGDHFFGGAVRALLDPNDRAEVDLRLSSLLRKDLIRPERSSLPREDAYRFRHLLIRDAAYEAMPKQLRAQLHEGYASWLERVAEGEITEHEEIVGFHMEQAVRYRTELGLDRDPALAERAAEYLAAAGRRASTRLDLPASSNLLGRAAALLPHNDPDRMRLKADEGVALSRLGESRRAEGIFDEVIEAARRSGNVVIEARARIDRLWARRDTEPARWLEEMRAEVEPLIPVLEDHRDDLGLTKGLQLLASGWQFEGRMGESESLLETALVFARRAGDPLEEAEIVAEFLFALPFGPTPVEDALRRAEEIASQVQADLRFDGWVLGVRSELEAMRGRFEEARRLATSEEEIHRELRWGIFSAAYHRWFIETLAGRPGAAEDAIRQRLDGLHSDEVMSRWGVDALLASSLCEQGRFLEARELADRWATTDGDDRHARIIWLGVRARTAAHVGDLDEAQRHAREGVEIAAVTDELNTRANSLMNLAWVQREANDTAGARTSFTDAVQLYERKGNVAAAARARAWWGDDPAVLPIDIS